jgi:hypothetical protein
MIRGVFISEYFFSVSTRFGLTFAIRKGRKSIDIFRFYIIIYMDLRRPEVYNIPISLSLSGEMRRADRNRHMEGVYGLYLSLRSDYDYGAFLTGRRLSKGRYCRKHQKKYATIDCTYDSDINRYCEVNVLSHEYLELTYPGQDCRELFRHYTKNTDGLIIFTFGEKEIMFGRKGQEPKYFKPYPIQVVSTLGAGDSFKAGAIYALDQGMSDEELVSFASATAGVACENYPIPLHPPTLEKIREVQSRKR